MNFERNCIREKIRINQYKYLLSMTEGEKSPVQVENGDDMERVDMQIKEVKSLITWTYDFPDVLKLLLGAMASVVILVANVLLSISIEDSIT